MYVIEESLRYWKKRSKKYKICLYQDLSDGCFCVSYILQRDFKEFAHFPIRKGLEIPSNLSRNIIPFAAAFTIILVPRRNPFYPVEKARSETNPPTNLMYPRIFRFRIRFLDTRVFLFFFFVHGLDIDSRQRNFRFASPSSRVPSRVSLEDDSRIVDFIALSTFTARRRSWISRGNELVSLKVALLLARLSPYNRKIKCSLPFPARLQLSRMSRSTVKLYDDQFLSSLKVTTVVLSDG